MWLVQEEVCAGRKQIMEKMDGKGHDNMAEGVKENSGRTGIFQEISELAENLSQNLTAVRRDFHKYAETGWFEMRTSSLIARRLTDLGYEVLTGDQVCKKDSRMGVPSDAELEKQYERAVSQGADPEFVERTRGGMTGVIGILHCGEGPVVAMRFDIDALGVFESGSKEHRPAREGFSSVNEGFMHACGHDGHAAIGLGVAEVLMKIKDHLHGTVKLIFQPAEEGVRGAKAIVDAGHLDDVQYLIGSHVTDCEEDGSDEVVIPGCHGCLATTKYDVVFRGQAAHAGGSPEKGKNVLLAAATAILNLYAIPRHSEGASRINVGTVHGGSGRNVIADEAKMEIEVRGETTAINEYMSEYALNILNGAAAMHGVTCEVKVMGAANSMASSQGMMDRIRRVTEQDLHMKVSGQDSLHAGGSEDVSYMVNRVQEHGGEASFMRLLTKEAGPGHSRTFDIDEKVLPAGVKIFCGVVYDIMA